jgi:hypothetical protein
MEFKARVGSEDFRKKKSWQQDVYKVRIAYQSGDEIQLRRRGPGRLKKR